MLFHILHNNTTFNKNVSTKEYTNTKPQNETPKGEGEIRLTRTISTLMMSESHVKVCSFQSITWHANMHQIACKQVLHLIRFILMTGLALTNADNDHICTSSSKRGQNADDGPTIRHANNWWSQMDGSSSCYLEELPLLEYHPYFDSYLNEKCI